MKTVSVIKRIHFYLLIIPIRVYLNIYLGFVNMTHNSDSSIDSRLGTRSPWRSRIEIFDHIMVKFGPSYNNRQITHGWNELLIRFVVSLNIFKISQTLKSQFNEVRWPIFQLLLGYVNVGDMLKMSATDLAVFVINAIDDIFSLHSKEICTILIFKYWISMKWYTLDKIFGKASDQYFN